MTEIRNGMEEINRFRLDESNPRAHRAHSSNRVFIATKPTKTMTL